jgi:hypothetical protein
MVGHLTLGRVSHRICRFSPVTVILPGDSAISQQNLQLQFHGRSLIAYRELWEIIKVAQRNRAVSLSGKSTAAKQEHNVQVYDRPDHVCMV